MDKKSIFKILTIFFLGMGIGAFLMGGFTKHRMRQIHRHHAGKGFSEALIHITQVEGDEKERLIQLGEEYGNRLKGLQEDYFQRRAEVLDELEEKGITFLKNNQKERFQHHLRRMKNGPRNRREREGD